MSIWKSCKTMLGPRSPVRGVRGAHQGDRRDGTEGGEEGKGEEEGEGILLRDGRVDGSKAL